MLAWKALTPGPSSGPIPRKEHADMDAKIPRHIKEYVAAAPVCRIGTVRADGEPHVIPVCPVFDGDQTVFIDIGRRSTTALALQREPRITVLIDDYSDDWTKLRKVILRCSASEVRGHERKKAWELIRTKFPQHTAVGWKPRLTMALEIREWLQEGFGVA